MTPEMGILHGKNIIYHLAAVLLAILMLSACADKVEVPGDPFFEEWRAMVEESRPHAPASRPRRVDLPERPPEPDAREEKPVAVASQALPTRPVTMVMRNTDVNTILRALSKSAGVNIMVNADVSGTMNVDVTDTPWDQVFTSVLATRGLNYEWQGEIIRIISLADMQHDKEIEAIKRATARETQEIKKIEPLLMRIIKLDYADAATMQPAMEELLTRQLEEQAEREVIRGSVTVDVQTNSLVIHAIGDDIVKMIALVEELDTPADQVLIEANIVETTREVARELGVQWGGLHHTTAGGQNFWITPGANSTGILGTDIATPIAPTSGMASNFPADLGDGIGMTLGYVAESLGDYVLTVQLSALERAQKLNILSSPSITTLDNQKAMIESGAKVPFQTIDVNGQIDIKFEDAVLRLEVTPHVINRQVMKLRIITTKDEVDFTRTVQGNPTIIKKRAETNLILHDGQTTVIGGLSKETNTKRTSGTPELQDLPVLGHLFKTTRNSTQMEEVLIFITPHIIKKKSEELGVRSEE